MNIITFLKSNSDARKIFGEREIKIIEKQLLGINLTQSEKNRLSRDIRKKLEFIKQINQFSNSFNLKKAELIKKYIIEAKEEILKDQLYKSINKIIVYGSYVENKLTFQSDIDLAVEFSEISLKESTLFRKRISGKINQKIDLQVYNYLPDKIKKEIKYKRLYQK